MFPLPWPQLLMGLSSQKIQGNIYQVYVHAYGPSQIGPYNELKEFAKTATIYQFTVDAHHIVNGEHLAGTGWNYQTAPCIVMDKGMHRQYHGRFNEVLTDYHGRFDAGSISQKDKLELYHDMFVLQTEWKELWTIAARIITRSVTVPHSRTFLTP